MAKKKTPRLMICTRVLLYMRNIFRVCSGLRNSKYNYYTIISRVCKRVYATTARGFAEKKKKPWLTDFNESFWYDNRSPRHRAPVKACIELLSGQEYNMFYYHIIHSSLSQTCVVFPLVFERGVIFFFLRTGFRPNNILWSKTL